MFPNVGLTVPCNPSGRKAEQRRGSFAIQFGKLPKGTPIPPPGPNPRTNLRPPTSKGHSEGLHFGGSIAPSNPSGEKQEQRRGSLGIQFGKQPKDIPIPPPGSNPRTNLRTPTDEPVRMVAFWNVAKGRLTPPPSPTSTIHLGQPPPGLYNRNT
ncbi:hypothetical protein Acr_15g0009220 [Actinidia rufa]|uniref:Uncharacterized protein n=1 Tax=Actinidia rufa TaxID=165716 RepID=A0A7J0FUR3_9ERIC|nr:hypothetical protein Acr_15g0009220 [Actinidia rufa]